MTSSWCELVGWVHHNPIVVCRGWKGFSIPLLVWGGFMEMVCRGWIGWHFGMGYIEHDCILYSDLVVIKQCDVLFQYGLKMIVWLLASIWFYLLISVKCLCFVVLYFEAISEYGSDWVVVCLFDYLWPRCSFTFV